MPKIPFRKGPNAISKEEAKERHEKHGFKGTPHHAMKMADHLMQRAQGGVDVTYLKTVLYPELYNADVPQPLSTQSYTRFSDKKEMSIASNAEGMFLWFPKTTIGPQLFWKSGLGCTALEKPFDSTTWKMGGWQDYSEYFSQANLVSASIQIQYIGQLQNEQGYFVGSHQFGTSLNTITSEDIENGQFRCFEKPGDGVRIIYVPKDVNDFSYYGLAKNTDGTYNSRNGGGRVPSDTSAFIMHKTAAGANVTYENSDFMEGSFSQQAQQWFGPETAGKRQAKADIKYATDCDYIAIYYKGLYVSGQNQAADLRIDITRKFNGFPLAKHRDVLDLQKPRKIFDPKRTIDIVSELQDNIPQLVSHSLKNMDKVSDEIQEFLPNVGHLYNEGMLKEGTSLQGFSDQLQAVNGMQGNVIVPGRLYE